MKPDMSGSYSLLKPKRPKHLWANPKVPEHYPNWYAHIKFRGKQRMICTDTADRRKAESRAKDVLERLKDDTWEAAKSSMGLRRTSATLDELCAQLLANTPEQKADTARRCVAALKAIVSQSTGKWEGVPVSALAGNSGMDLGLRWMRMRQRYQALLAAAEEAEEVLEATGWHEAQSTLKAALAGRRRACAEAPVVAARAALDALESGDVTAAIRHAKAAGHQSVAETLAAGESAWRDARDARAAMDWTQLRRALDAGDLPPLNVDTRAPGNTTINSMVNQAKAVFSDRARAFRLRGAEIPDLSTGFGALPRIAVPPTGFEPIPSDVYARMHEASIALQKEDPQLWLVNQMLRRLGLRGGELMSARDTWLWEDVQGWRREGRGWVLVVKDRPEEGFYTKSGAARARYLPLDDDLAAILVGRTGLLIGVETRGAAYDLVMRRHNRWLRQFLPDRQKANHELRKHIGAIIYSSLGKEAAADYLGHASADVTERYYSAWLQQRPVITQLDLAETSCLRRFRKSAVSYNPTEEGLLSPGQAALSGSDEG